MGRCGFGSAAWGKVRECWFMLGGGGVARVVLPVLRGSCCLARVACRPPQPGFAPGIPSSRHSAGHVTQEGRCCVPHSVCVRIAWLVRCVDPSRSGAASANEMQNSGGAAINKGYARFIIRSFAHP